MNNYAEYGMEDYLTRYKSCKAFHFNKEDVLDNEEPIVMGSLDVSVTTCCNLRCKGCASLISYYEKRNNQDMDLVIRSLTRILKNVNTVLRLNVLGGEPFLHNELYKLIECIISQDKIKKTIIMTNGLVFPSDNRLLAALKDPRIEVRISQYKNYLVEQNKLESILRSNGICYSIKRFGVDFFKWYDFGEVKNYCREKNEIDEQYKQCDVEAQYLYNGRLYVCPRAAHGIELGLIPVSTDCCIDVIESTDVELKNKMTDMIFKKSPYGCCSYCNRGTDQVKTIPVAEQIN